MTFDGTPTPAAGKDRNPRFGAPKASVNYQGKDRGSMRTWQMTNDKSETPPNPPPPQTALRMFGSREPYQSLSRTRQRLVMENQGRTGRCLSFLPFTRWPCSPSEAQNALKSKPRNGKDLDAT